jgi:hypothetical protein
MRATDMKTLRTIINLNLRGERVRETGCGQIKKALDGSR